MDSVMYDSGPESIEFKEKLSHAMADAFITLVATEIKWGILDEMNESALDSDRIVSDICKEYMS